MGYVNEAITWLVCVCVSGFVSNGGGPDPITRRIYGVRREMELCCQDAQMGQSQGAIPEENAAPAGPQSQDLTSPVGRVSVITLVFVPISVKRVALLCQTALAITTYLTYTVACKHVIMCSPAVLWPLGVKMTVRLQNGTSVGRVVFQVGPQMLHVLS